MRVLLVHRSYPGQFRYLAAALATIPGCEIVFLTLAEAGCDDLGICRVQYQPTHKASMATHSYVRNLENAVGFGQAAYRSAAQLKASGWEPDIILGHSGWGPTLFLKDIFPRSVLLCYYEWFYRARGSSHGFDPAVPVTPDIEAEVRTKNAGILLDLASCDGGICPTHWQCSQFPAEFRTKIEVLHDGVHTEYFAPKADQPLLLPRVGLELAAGSEVVTYVATGMEPMRGFPQFMEAVSLLQRQRPHCQVIVVGEDRIEYSNPLPDGRTYRQQAMEQHPFDLSRLHFTGRLSLDELRQLFWVSRVHVYLTYPYILSWSMLEAMASGCLVVASDTPPVREFIEHGVNGMLTDFFSPEQLADTVAGMLEDPGATAAMRRRARETILTSYDLQRILPRQVDWLRRAAGHRHRGGS
ncbi:MAG TPA: glycosyltransferase [Patescibacteria group bacterium]|nr:glycosyltransferase [Patescibacteria group bacterium]